MPADPKKYTYHWKDQTVSHPEIPGGKPIIKAPHLSLELVTDNLDSGNFTEAEFVT